MTILRRASALCTVVAAAAAFLRPAAPQPVVPVEQTPYHVPVFSNDLVTVLNVFIPPERTSGFHRHVRTLPSCARRLTSAR